MASTNRRSQSKDSNRRAAARRTSKSSSSSSSSSRSSSNSPDPTKTESKVQARAALDEGTGLSTGLEERAREQEKRQAQELRDGVASGEAKKAHDARQKVGKDNRAALRQPGGVEPQGPIGGFVDQTTARPGDAREGHFVQIDLSADGITDELRERGNLFGVYVEPGELDSDGYPLTAQVRMRDETNALVTVPYAALSETSYRGR